MMNQFSIISSRDEDGASAVEYGLLVVAIAAAVTLVVFLLGTVVSGQFTNTCDQWHQQTAASDC